ncbi:hypothetical protein [Halarcobacter ebronensis]|uniref:Uncharacterized protein n=1 Tax=Halarcobacter ebronensis TaxID=1462615 RepID=A0A4Q1AT77_9BACT|nr:hypothetical protein [Halarcobacter ebronensis]QKF82021.1 hypothetical protein AEBR_1538 [Halarcobacter ebronensis]RXK04268.1 hypothetical protein CRV07_10865 [Halarcobacter ebronensis]
MENNQRLDEWDEKLELKLVELNECQTTNGLDSCTPCDKFFECELRKRYILAVYESMNKGSGGGFEF